jgi:hypothetical protein
MSNTSVVTVLSGQEFVHTLFTKWVAGLTPLSILQGAAIQGMVTFKAARVDNAVAVEQVNEEVGRWSLTINGRVADALDELSPGDVVVLQRRSSGRADRQDPIVLTSSYQSYGRRDRPHWGSA